MADIQNNAVTPFDFGGHSVRTMLLNGIAWFVLVDVCRVIEIGNPSQAASRLDDDEKYTLISSEGDNINGLAIVGAMPTIITESGLYSLILTSRKPQAKAFKRWITGTVLPALRRDGMYVMGEEKVLAGEMSEDEMILKAMTAMTAKVERLRIEKDALSATVVIMAPKVALVDVTFAQGGKIG